VGFNATVVARMQRTVVSREAAVAEALELHTRGHRRRSHFCRQTATVLGAIAGAGHLEACRALPLRVALAVARVWVAGTVSRAVLGAHLGRAILATEAGLAVTEPVWRVELPMARAVKRAFLCSTRLADPVVDAGAGQVGGDTLPVPIAIVSACACAAAKAAPVLVTAAAAGLVVTPTMARAARHNAALVGAAVAAVA